MNDVRMMLTVFLTFALFGAFIGFFPAELYPVEYEYSVTVPAYYEGMDITSYSITANFTIDDATFPLYTTLAGLRYYVFDLGGINWVMFIDTAYNQIWLGERNYFGIFWISHDFLQFKTEQENRGIILHGSELNQDFTGNETWVSYRMLHPIEPEKGCDVNFGFNTSLYSSPWEALLNEELTVFIGMGFDDLYTSLNAWQLVATFFIYSPPNIHPLVNGILKTVTWSIVGVALVLFVGRFVPLIQGGS